MTFSIVGHCQRSGAFGVAITTSSICVGARCSHARAGVGAVATQNITDPALGPRVLDQLAAGNDAPTALEAALAGRDHLAYRQLVVVDRHGQSACHTGTQILGNHAETAGAHCFAAGNLLSNPGVTAAMVGAFEQHQAQPLPERLLRSLEAGLDAGGEQGAVHSAALLVVEQQPFPLVDLRVDWSDNAPLADLRRLWQAYQPQQQDYLMRALNPAAAPSYGVPGDE